MITFLAPRVYKSKHFSHPCHSKMRKRKQPNRQTQNQRHQFQSHNRRSMYSVTLLYIVFLTSNSLVSNNKSVLYLVINKTVHLFTERMILSAFYTMTRLRGELSCQNIISCLHIKKTKSIIKFYLHFENLQYIFRHVTLFLEVKGGGSPIPKN